MPALPTPEDHAKKILEICVYHYKAKPGHSVPMQSVYFALIQDEKTAENLEPGIQRAVELGWLELPNGLESSSVIVTPEGYQAV